MWSRACIECELLFGLMIVFSLQNIQKRIVFFLFFIDFTLFFAALFEGYLAILGQNDSVVIFVTIILFFPQLSLLCVRVCVILQVDAAVMNACLQAAAASLNSQSRYYLHLTDSLVLLSSVCLFLNLCF